MASETARSLSKSIHSTESGAFHMHHSKSYRGTLNVNSKKVAEGRTDTKELTGQF